MSRALALLSATLFQVRFLERSDDLALFPKLSEKDIENAPTFPATINAYPLHLAVSERECRGQWAM
jgi:hypothetical protein